MRITRAVVPSLFTVLNIFSGFNSIVHSSRGEYTIACWFIILAGIFDSLDGVMARITKSSSDFGVELDSLSDVVSFGAAPSFMVYNLYLHTIEGWGMLLSALPMIFGALRLARFNVQLVGYDKDYFKGLPIPAMAIIIVSFILQYVDGNNQLPLLAASLLPYMVVILSLLMVSNIKYDTIPKFSKKGIKYHPLRFTAAIIGLTAIIITKGNALFPFFVFYLATGPIRYIIHFFQNNFRNSGKHSEAKDPEITSIDI
jgi:CDP-diacylglycerol---serine O-phosphatidyltransferase